METSLAKRTVDRATSAMQGGAVVCLPEIVKLMRTLSHKSSEVSVPELAEVIQKDTAILAKVVGAANTFGYNPAAVPVLTVTQAIHVIGYERIRSLAMSLLLVEQTARTRNPAEQREVAALALTAGCIAQSAAETRSLLNPEEAFVCASLRNFGRIIMATCMLDDYQEARQLADELPPDEAYRRIFGLTPLELGHRLLEASDLPEELLLTLRALPPETLAVLKTDPDSQMLALTDFSAQLAELALNPQLSAAVFAQRSQSLATRYEKVLPGLAAETATHIESALQQLDHFVHTLRIKTLPPHTLVRLKQRTASIDPSASIGPVPRPAKPAAAPPAPTAAPTPPAPSQEFSWQAEIDRLVEIAAREGIAQAALFEAAVDSVSRGLATPECLLFSTSTNSHEIRVSHGRGTCFAALNGSATVRLQERTVFGICLARGENILIHHAADPKLAPYLPAWLPSRRVLGAFVLLPIVSERATRGLILAGWPDSRQIVLPPDHVRLIRLLLASVVSPREAAAA